MATMKRINLMLNEVDKLQHLLFDGYLRMQILNIPSKDTRNWMCMDVINLCNQFYILPFQSLWTKYEIQVLQNEDLDEEEDDMAEIIHRTTLEMFGEFDANNEYFISSIMLRILIKDPWNELFHGQYHYLLGMTLHDWNKYTLNDEYISKQAIDEFEKAVTLRPEHGNRYYYGECLQDLGKYKLAIAEYQQCDEFHPEQIAACYKQLNNFNQAKKYYRYAFELNPTERVCRQYRKLLQYHFKDYEKAKECLLVLIGKYHRNHAFYYGDLAECYDKLKDFKNAEKMYLRAIEIKPNDSGLRYHFASMLQRNEKYELAMVHLLEAVRFEPMNCEYITILCNLNFLIP